MPETPRPSYISADVVALLSEQLGRPINYHLVYSLIRRGQIDSPPMGRDGCFRWAPEHIDAARAVLEARPVRRPKAATAP
jgi:hypothetical protein